METTIIPKVDDLILSPEHSDSFRKDLPWIVCLVDCEIRGIPGHATNHPPSAVTGQIICQGTRNNLEKIRYAAKLFCRDTSSLQNEESRDECFKDEIFIPNNQVHKLFGKEGRLLLEKIMSSMEVTLHKTYSYKNSKIRFIIWGRCRTNCLEAKALLKSFISSSVAPSPTEKLQQQQQQSREERSFHDEYDNKENVPPSISGIANAKQESFCISTSSNKSNSDSIRRCPSSHNRPPQQTNNIEDTISKKEEICYMIIHYWPRYVKTLRLNKDDQWESTHSNHQPRRQDMITLNNTAAHPAPQNKNSSNDRHNLMIEDVTETDFRAVQEQILKPFHLFTLFKTNDGRYLFSTFFQSAAEAVLFTKRVVENLVGMQNVYYLHQTFELEKMMSNNNDEKRIRLDPCSKNVSQHLLVRRLTPITVITALHVINQFSGSVSIWKKSCGAVFMLEILLESVEDAEYCTQAIQTTIKTEGGAVVEYVDSKFDLVRI